MTGLRTAAIAAAAIACAGCPKSNQESTTVKTGSGTGLSNLVKKTVVSWGFSPAGDSTDVYLATTNETGSVTSHPVGRYFGTCEKFTAPEDMHALIAAKCAGPDLAGVELHAVKQGNVIVVMKMSHATADPMAREEVTRITIDLGAAIEAAP